MIMQQQCLLLPSFLPAPWKGISRLLLPLLPLTSTGTCLNCTYRVTLMDMWEKNRGGGERTGVFPAPSSDPLKAKQTEAAAAAKIIRACDKRRAKHMPSPFSQDGTPPPLERSKKLEKKKRGRKTNSRKFVRARQAEKGR